MEWLVLLAVLVPFALVLLLPGVGRQAAADAQARRLAAIERKLDLVIAHLGIQVPEPDAPTGVLDELLAGRKIQAIKRYRQATGASLVDAKNAVEQLAARHGLP